MECHLKIFIEINSRVEYHKNRRLRRDPRLLKKKKFLIAVITQFL